MGKSRHLSRIVVMQTLYEWDFREKNPDLESILIRNIHEFKDQVDEEFSPKCDKVQGLWDFDPE